MGTHREIEVWGTTRQGQEMRLQSNDPKQGAGGALMWFQGLQGHARLLEAPGSSQVRTRSPGPYSLGLALSLGNWETPVKWLLLSGSIYIWKMDQLQLRQAFRKLGRARPTSPAQPPHTERAGQK